MLPILESTTLRDFINCVCIYYWSKIAKFTYLVKSVVEFHDELWKYINLKKWTNCDLDYSSEFVKYGLKYFFSQKIRYIMNWKSPINWVDKTGYATNK